MTEELAGHHLPARQGIAQQQQQRTALVFTDDRIEGKRQGNQGDEIDTQAGKAYRGHSEGGGAGFTDRRRAEQRQ